MMVVSTGIDTVGLGAANWTQIPEANIVGVCTAGFERTGGFSDYTMENWRSIVTRYRSIKHNSYLLIWEREMLKWITLHHRWNTSSGALIQFPVLEMVKFWYL